MGRRRSLSACALTAVLLLVRSAPGAAVGQHVPTEFSQLIRDQPPENGWIGASECEKHSQCGAGKFCKWTWADSWEGWWFVGGTCAPCSECECK